MLNVTSETIRRDLSLLESEGKITKIHGGAVKKQVVQEDAFSARIEAHREEKIAIGKLAAEMVSERDTLFIDSCTTNLILAEQLPPLAFFRDYQFSPDCRIKLKSITCRPACMY